MKSNLISINDIAKKLGVSVSTVSRALKNHPDISKETCERIQAFARSVNYRPNALALSLKKQRSNTIGLIIPEIQHHFFSSIISGVEDIAYANEFRVMICQSNDDYNREVLNTQALLDHRVDGILVSLGKHTMHFDHFHVLLEHDIPLVFFDRVCDKIDTDRVMTDDAGGARSVVNHMIAKGHRKILHLAASQSLSVGRDRCKGYFEALRSNHIEIDPELVMICDTMAEVERLGDQILSRVLHIDSIFAVNDFTAIAAIQLLQAHGIDVPQRVAVAGFGDDPIASIVRPRLTTVEQKGFDIGAEAVRLLIDRIKNPGESSESRHKVFSTNLKIREST